MAKQFSPGSRPPYYKRNYRGPKHRKNERIRIPQVRLIKADGTQVGVVATQEALKMAKAQGLDLVEVSANTFPPICKILDYGKFMYSESKKNKGQKTQTSKLKEIKFRLNIDEHDYQTKIHRAEDFLAKGHKVKLTLTMRGREMSRKDIGYELIKRAIKDLVAFGSADLVPKLMGRHIYTMISPTQEKAKSATPQKTKKVPSKTKSKNTASLSAHTQKSAE